MTLVDMPLNARLSITKGKSADVVKFERSKLDRLVLLNAVPPILRIESGKDILLKDVHPLKQLLGMVVNDESISKEMDVKLVICAKAWLDSMVTEFGMCNFNMPDF